MEFVYVRSMACFLLLATACTVEKANPPVPPNSTTEVITPGPIRRTLEEVVKLKTLAEQGNISAMRTLAAHHITAGETIHARFWLGKAVKHGDCHALYLLIEETYLNVPFEELPHWRNEERRLGCDPDKSYMNEISKPPRRGRTQ